MKSSGHQTGKAEEEMESKLKHTLDLPERIVSVKNLLICLFFYVVYLSESANKLNIMRNKKYIMGKVSVKGAQIF